MYANKQKEIKKLTIYKYKWSKNTKIKTYLHQKKWCTWSHRVRVLGSSNICEHHVLNTARKNASTLKTLQNIFFSMWMATWPPILIVQGIFSLVIQSSIWGFFTKQNYFNTKNMEKTVLQPLLNVSNRVPLNIFFIQKINGQIRQFSPNYHVEKIHWGIFSKKIYLTFTWYERNI